MQAKNDIFQNIKNEYGMNLPGIDEPRVVRIYKGKWKKSLMIYIKDMDTGIVTCGFTMDQCKKGLAELLLRQHVSSIRT
jgi:hypothetical protein